MIFAAGRRLSEEQPYLLLRSARRTRESAMAAVSTALLVLIALLLPASCHRTRCDVPVTAGPQPRRLALLVGITRYNEQVPPRRDHLLHSLNGAEDALLLQKVLTNPPWSLPPEDVMLLSDERATRAGIIEKFRELTTRRAEPGDAVLVYLGGHGMEIPDNDGDELDGTDESFVPWDYISDSAEANADVNLRDDDIGRMLADLRKAVGPGGSVTVVLDWCHSGTGTRALDVVRGRGWDVERDGGPHPPPNPNGRPKGTSGMFLLGQPEKDGFAVIAAAMSNEEAHQADFGKYGSPFNSSNHGRLSGALAITISERGPDLTFYKLFDRVSAIVADRTGLGEPQHVQLEGVAADRPFLGRPARRGPPHLVVKGGVLADGRSIELPVGQAHGATVGSRFGLFRPCATGAREKIAEAELEVVQAFTSRARISDPLPSASDRGALQGAWAVEQSHRFVGQTLKLYVPARTTLPSSLIDLPFIETTRVAGPEHLYDFSVSQEDGKWMIRRLDGSLATSPILDDAGGPGAITEFLLAQWRWAYLAQLESPQTAPLPPPEVEIVPVSGAQTEGAPSQRSFVEGSVVTLRVRIEPSSAASDGVWVTLLQLAPDGTITSLFPAPGDVSGNRVAADGKPHRLPQPDYQFRMELQGRYFLKAIATTVPVDFSAIVNAPAGRSRDLALARAPADLSALAVLWSAAGDVQLPEMRVPLAEWSTSQIAFDVVGANGPR